MLTARQLLVARLIADGYTNEEIAEKIGVTARTIKGHSDVIRQRLGVQHRRKIAKRLRELGLLEPPGRDMSHPKTERGTTTHANKGTKSEDRRESSEG